MRHDSYIGVIDFGSQTTMLIVRRIREMGVLAKIVPASITKEQLMSDPPIALILSGGPESLRQENAIRIDPSILDLNLPTLGICYGMQLLAEHFGGHVNRAHAREFGKRNIDIDDKSKIFSGLGTSLEVWMSHSDQVEVKPDLFRTIAQSPSCPIVAMEHEHKKIFGVQFHPEVFHTQHGDKVLSNFIFGVVKAEKNFDMGDFLDRQIEAIRQKVKDSHVIMGLSGGVDSSVAALIIHRAIGRQLHCVYVDHGLARKGETEEIRALFGTMEDLDLHVVHAQEMFLEKLKGITDPEQKRKLIGHVFIDVFEQEAKRFPQVKFLGQGTLYPDVIESECKNRGPSHVIKSHHNVGGLPERMNLMLLEPLRDLFKDEVRKIGSLLGLKDTMVKRQPFPGPGLAVRIPGEVTKERTETLRHADAIVREEIDRLLHEKSGLNNLWQWFAILLPIRSVGVMGDARSFGETIVIRCVESVDAMTADWAKLPYELLGHISSRITNEVPGISRVLYDITQKPPGTIEWE